KGVTFDWWGTIAVIPARSDSGTMRAFRIGRLEVLLREQGLRPAPSVLSGAYDRQGERLERMWAEHRELPPDEQVRTFMRFAGLDGVGLPAAEVAHVGDDVIADVAGAKAVGMRAVWFNTGFWKGATTDRADAEIRGHGELPRLLEKWR